MQSDQEIIEFFLKFSQNSRNTIYDQCYSNPSGSTYAWLKAMQKMKKTKILRVSSLNQNIKFHLLLRSGTVITHGLPSNEFLSKLKVFCEMLYPMQIKLIKNYSNPSNLPLDFTTLFLLRLDYGEQKMIELMDMWIDQSYPGKIVEFLAILENFDRVKDMPLIWAAEIASQRQEV